MKEVTIPSPSSATVIDVLKRVQPTQGLPADLVPCLTASVQRVVQLVECFFAGRADRREDLSVRA
jgi:hypothetical protein